MSGDLRRGVQRTLSGPGTLLLTAAPLELSDARRAGLRRVLAQLGS